MNPFRLMNFDPFRYLLTAQTKHEMVLLPKTHPIIGLPKTVFSICVRIDVQRPLLFMSLLVSMTLRGIYICDCQHCSPACRYLNQPEC